MRMIRYDTNTGYAQWKTSKIQVAVCCSEPEEFMKYQKMIVNTTIANDHEVKVHSFNKGEAIIDFFRSRDAYIDAIILEVELGEDDGIEIAKTLRREGYIGEIIFLALDSKCYVQAFEVRAFQYVIKQEAYEALLEQTVINLLKQLEYGLMKYIWVTDNREYRQILMEDIYYFEVNKRNITIHYKDGSFQFLYTMGKIQDRLSDRQFVRIHQSYLVARWSVKRIVGGKIHMVNGVELPIGRTYRKMVYDDLKQIHNSKYEDDEEIEEILEREEQARKVR